MNNLPLPNYMALWLGFPHNDIINNFYYTSILKLLLMKEN